MKKFLLLMLGLGACAPYPDAVMPANMVGTADHMSCSQIARELRTEQQRLAILESKQRAAATADSVGVFLVLIPVSSATGGDVQASLAISKGRVLMLQGAQAQKCP